MYGVVDNPRSGHALHERMQRLQDSQRAWQRCTPSFDFEIHGGSTDLSRGSTLSGSILAFLREPERVHVVQIPSSFRNIPKKEWDIVLPRFHVSSDSYGIDQSQNLLIAVQRWFVLYSEAVAVFLLNALGATAAYLPRINSRFMSSTQPLVSRMLPHPKR